MGAEDSRAAEQADNRHSHNAHPARQRPGSLNTASYSRLKNLLNEMCPKFPSEVGATFSICPETRKVLAKGTEKNT